jgi:tetratricopeptide (TPR) repeat protein
MLLVPQNQDIAITVTLEGYYLSKAIIPNIVIIKAEDRQKTLTIQLTKKPLPTGKKRIAVLPFCDDSPQDVPLIDGAFTAKAAEALSQIDQQNLETIDHMLVWTAMQRNQLRNDNYCDMEQIMKLSNDINANVVILGMYQRDDDAKEENRWRVVCTFFDLSNNQSYCKQILQTAPSLPILQNKLYNEILKRLEIPITSESEQIIESYTTKTTENEQSYTHLLNGSQYNTQQEPQKAKAELNKSIEKDNDNFRAYQERGISEASAGNTEEAQKDYQKAKEKAEKKGIIKKVIDWIKEKALRENLRKDYKAWVDITNRSQNLTLWVFTQGIAVFSSNENGKYGYIDTLGNLIVEPIYDITLPFSEGRAVAIKDSTWYLIDKSGKILTTKKQNSNYIDRCKVRSAWMQEITSLRVRSLGLSNFSASSLILDKAHSSIYSDYLSSYDLFSKRFNEVNQANEYFYSNGVILFKDETGKDIRLDLEGNEIEK